MIKVSIIIPYLRDNIIDRCISSIKENAGILEEEYEIVIEKDTERIGCPKMVKKLVYRSNSDRVLFIGEDVIAKKDFIKEALIAMNNFSDGIGLAALNDGDALATDDSRKCKLASHWIADKRLLEFLDGEFFHTGYDHSYCDNELTDRCYNLGKYTFAEKSIIVHAPVRDKFHVEKRKTSSVKYDRSLYKFRKENEWKTPIAWDGERCIPNHMHKNIRTYMEHNARYNYALRYVRNRKVLDASCFVKGTRIQMKDNLVKNIEDINIGDIVLSHMDKNRKVISTKCIDINSTLRIKSLYGYELECTSDHLIFSVKKDSVRCNHFHKQSCNTNNNGDCSTCSKINPFSPKFNSSYSLNVGDFLCLPKHKNKKATRSKNNFNIATILGYYLSEGCRIYSHKPKVCGLAFTLNINEDYIVDEIKESIKNLTYTSISVKKFPEINTMRVCLYSKELAESIIKLGGNGSSNKRLDKSVFLWNENDKIQLIRCWLNGDGHYRNCFKKGEVYRGKTVSPYLAKDLKGILKSLNILCGFGIEKPLNKKNVFSLILCGSDIDYFHKRDTEYQSKRRYRQDNSYFYIPIISIKKNNSRQKVYDFTVDKDHSYLANEIGVHNCGTGYGTNMLYDIAKEVFGVDVNPAALSYAKENYRGKFGFCDLNKDFPVEAFDSVVSFETIEHLKNPEFFLENVKKHSREFIFSIPIELQLVNNNNQFHLHKYSVETAKELIESVFGKIRVRYWIQAGVNFYNKYEDPRYLIGYLDQGESWEKP